MVGWKARSYGYLRQTFYSERRRVNIQLQCRSLRVRLPSWWTSCIFLMESHSHDAQPCYCGEANCVGFLGGKTQTDVAAMDDLYLDGRYLKLTSLIVILTHIQRSVLLMRWNHKDSRVRGRRRARNLTKITSRLSDLSLTRRFRKSFKLFDNRKAEKYYSSYLPVSRCAPKWRLLLWCLTISPRSQWHNHRYDNLCDCVDIVLCAIFSKIMQMTSSYAQTYVLSYPK